MSKTGIGLLFITLGLLYGTMLLDAVYAHTLGYLIEHEWIQPPVAEKLGENLLGRKPTIFLYSLGLIIIGIFILWNREM